MNETHEAEDAIVVTIGDASYTLDPNLLRKYVAEAFQILMKEAEAKADFKSGVEAMEETFGVPKGVLTKWLKARYKAETKKQQELADAFSQLDASVE